MNSVKDDRQELPVLAKYLVITVFGITGISFFLNGSQQVYISDSFLMFGSGIYSGLAAFGMVSFIGCIRRGKTFTGIFKEIKNILKT